MANIEINMPDGNGPNIEAGDGTAVAAPPSEQPQKGWMDRVLGEGPETQITNPTGEYIGPEASQAQPPDQTPGQAGQGTIDQEEVLNRNARARMVNEGGKPPGGGDEGGDGGGPEGPRNSEWETNPERGKWIVEQIVRMRTGMTYERRYNAENGPYLKQLYDELQDYVNKICIIRNARDPWDAYVRDGEGRVAGIKTIEDSPLEIAWEVNSDGERIPHLIKPPQQDQQTGAEPLAAPENLTGLLPIDQLTAIYENEATPPGQIVEAERQLGIYFKEARRKGLLNEADNLLKTAHELIKGGDPQARVLVLRYVAQAAEAFSNSFKLNRKDPEVFRLAGIGNIYANWARERLEVALAGQDQPDYREGEFRLDQVDQEGAETYWDVGHYPKYYEVTAKTPEQFLKAKESFLEMVRRGSLGKSPEEIYQHVDNFKEVFGQRGNQAADRGTVSHEFVIEQRLELEAQLFIFGADYSNETYNPDSYKKFMMAMALHEGPDRWVRLLRAGNGQVAVFTHLFDKESIMEIFNNPDGERGELDVIAQHFMQDQVKQMVIERGLGISLKDYDPTDEDPYVLKAFNDPEAKKTRDKIFRTNLEQLGMAMSDENFKALYEGFDQGDAHRSNYLHFMADQQLSLEDRKLPPFNQLPDSLKQSLNLGRIQIEIKDKRARIQRGEVVLPPKKTVIDLLSPSDKKIYQDAYEQAEANFDIAFQMQGATGEKVRRGGGFFFVDKNPHIQAYQKIQKVGDSELTIEEKRKQWSNSQWIGWILNELEDGKKLETFSSEERQLYAGLSDKDKENFTENMPIYQAEKFVQFSETWTKIKYADDSPVWENRGLWNDAVAQEIKSKNREAGNDELKNFKALYRAEKTKAARIRAGEEIRSKGFEAKLYDEDGTPMMLKRPKENPDGTLYEDANGNAEVEKVAVDFNTAIKHIYSRWTSHTYWAYQPENRHMLLAPQIFEAAKRIREGLSRPEDEDMLATQLLIADPTLLRVRKFPKKQMQREITLLNAAVEESYQGHWRINRNLHRLFLPNDGNPDKMRMGYNLEDWGGQSRFSMRVRDLVATQPKRFARRMAARLADMPMEISSMADIWGQDGVSGAVSMFADQIEKIGHQGVAGQFAITKFIDQMDYGWKLFERLVNGYVNEKGEDEEALYEKPTNNSDKTIKFRQQSFDISNFPEVENDLFYAYLESFGRLWIVLKLMRTTGSKVRNAQGVLWLENTDVFLPDGKYNPEIANSRDTGTSRHSERIFYDTFIAWLTSNGPGSGVEAYPDDAPVFAWLRKKVIADDGTGKKVERTVADWLFDKMGR